MKTAEEFYQQTIGHSYELDGVPKTNPIQCADFFKFACKLMLGYCWATGGDGFVDNWWYNRAGHASEFDFITDPAQLQNGDFVMWRHKSRGDTPFESSHVAMYHNGRMVGQNQPYKYVTDNQVDVSVWQRMLGAFRFKSWEVKAVSIHGNDLEQINAMGVAQSGRKITTSFHVYAMTGTTPKMVLKKFDYQNMQIYAIQIQVDSNVQIVTSYSPDTEFLCLKHSSWMLEHDWYEVACCNAGYFEMTGNVGKPVGAVLIDWSGKWADWHGESCVPAAGNGYPTLAWDDIKMTLLDKNASDIDMSAYHWLQGMGQSLVIDGQVNCNVGSTNGRYNIANNAVAVGFNNTTKVFTIMANVKSEISDGKLTTLQRAYIMRDLDCTVAVQGDGGGSTEIEWLAKVLSDSLDPATPVTPDPVTPDTPATPTTDDKDKQIATLTQQVADQKAQIATLLTQVNTLTEKAKKAISDLS